MRGLVGEERERDRDRVGWGERGRGDRVGWGGRGNRGEGGRERD